MNFVTLKVNSCCQLIHKTIKLCAVRLCQFKAIYKTGFDRLGHIISLLCRMLTSTTLLLQLSSLVHLTYSTDYYVTPDGHSSTNMGSNTYSLQHILNNPDQYFTSNTSFHFMAGQYSLHSRIVIKNITNIILFGHGDVTITCSYNSHGFAFVIVRKLKIKNIMFTNCSIDGRDDFKEHYPPDSYLDLHTHSQNTSFLLVNCSVIVFDNVSISITAGSYAIAAANVMNKFRLRNVTVLMNIHESSNSSIVSGGVMIHYNKSSASSNHIVSVQLENYRFIVNRISNNFTFIAIQVFLIQDTYNLNISISNTLFTNLHNSMALYYCVQSHKSTAQNRLHLIDIQAYNNTGSSNSSVLLPLFYIVMYGSGLDFSSTQLYSRQRSTVVLTGSSFQSNYNISTIINISLRKTLITATNITVYNCSVSNNINSHFIKTHSKINSLLQLTHFFRLESINVTNNTNVEGDNLMAFSHGHVNFKGLVIVQGNHYFENIITLYFSALRVCGIVILSHNKAYRLVNTLENSDFFFEESVCVKVLGNKVHTVIRKTDWFDDLSFTGYHGTAKVCPAQFYSARGNLDNQFAVGQMLNFSFTFHNNTITLPRYLITYDLGLKNNCTWLDGMTFTTTQPASVANKFINATPVIATKNDVYEMPSKICQCFPDNTHDCIYRDTTPIYPGQLLKLHLVVPSVDLNSKYPVTMLTLRTQKTDEGCIVENVSQIFQKHDSSNCSEYHYTIKYHSYKECQLYLRTQQHDTEILFVQLKPCPPGFVLDAEACQCDPQLVNVGVTSCNLDNATILRPANSWIYADTDSINNSHTYSVCLQCRFNFCLPHSSHLNLSDPDSQCQFNRTGVLCGQCQHGLSNVFGSPRCKACSHYYLFIIAPVVIVTFVLIVLIFKFNLTVTNGTINNFIFYIDIVGINMERYYPNCYNIVCIFTPSHSLDVCFYDGMSSYVKAWLFLCYPLYIIFIAVLLIIASRHSTKIQRLTAQRALPVLATLFMLTFTGLLRTVSFSLFYYANITHLPDGTKTVVWSIDSSIPIFGVKFIMLLIMCLILLFGLVTYNILLLFTKELLRFRIISTIKPFLDVYLALYNNTFSYWTGLQLLLRVAIFGFTALPSDMNLMFGALLLTVFLCLQAIVQPFKIRYYNIQHSLVLMSLVVINIISLYNKSNGVVELVGVKAIIFSVFVYFFVAIIGHCFVCAFNKVIKRNKLVLLEQLAKLKNKLTRKKNVDRPVEIYDYTSNIADVTYNYQKFQESLIDLD